MLAALMKGLHRPIYLSRLNELTRQIVPHLKPGDEVLDVGCGFGELGRTLADSADVRVTGLERAPRGNELIPVAPYDGGTIPFPDGNFDAVILADVLHHERDPERLIGECARVARRLLIIKDHKADTWFQHKRVSLMDWAANAPYDVPCLYRYLSQAGWDDLHRRMRHQVVARLNGMDLYPPMVNLIFGGKLQYMAIVDVAGLKD